MTGTRPSFTRLRERLRAREPLLGTFVKLPNTQPIEILGAVGFDFVVIDRENAPLGVAETDLMLLAARASDVAAARPPFLSHVPSGGPSRGCCRATIPRERRQPRPPIEDPLPDATLRPAMVAIVDRRGRHRPEHRASGNRS